MDKRQEKGKLLARGVKFVLGALWAVPSQSQNAGGYVVDTLQQSCSCPDFEERRCKCKHQWAVEFAQTTVTAPDGSSVTTETVRITRKTYSQDWASYNAAQCNEKEVVQRLLRALCDGIQSPAHKGRGRPRTPLADVTYAMAMKVYGTTSGRRAMTDLEACARAGHMDCAPSYNSVFDYFDREDMTPLLTALVEESAAPLASIESQFAVDSTGFGTVTYRRWYDAKYGKEMKEHGWVKAHAMVGTATNVITAIKVTDSAVNDCPELPGLVKITAERFTLKDVSADKAYLAHANLEAVEQTGAVPYIPFKVNSKQPGPAAWRRMWGQFIANSAEFLEHYHRRSNVESTFSAVKRLFGGSVRSKNPTAQVNEVLCKALCFNLSRLVHAIYELGIDPQFPPVTAVGSP